MACAAMPRRSSALSRCHPGFLDRSSLMVFTSPPGIRPTHAPQSRCTRLRRSRSRPSTDSHSHSCNGYPSGSVARMRRPWLPYATRCPVGRWIHDDAEADRRGASARLEGKVSEPGWLSISCNEAFTDIYSRICPLPSTTNFEQVNSSSPIGPRA